MPAVDLVLGFGQPTILKDIQLGVQKGVVIALLGPAGSDKTTQLAMRNSWHTRDGQPYQTSRERRVPPVAGGFPAGHIPAQHHWC